MIYTYIQMQMYTSSTLAHLCTYMRSGIFVATSFIFFTQVLDRQAFLGVDNTPFLSPSLYGRDESDENKEEKVVRVRVTCGHPGEVLLGKRLLLLAR